MGRLHPKAYIVTLGCPKNEADSERMARILAAGGYILTDDIDECDIALVNTCSFITDATEESISAILDVIDDGHVSECNVPVIVCGCMSSRYGEELESEFDEVSAFVPCEREDEILRIADECLGITGSLDEDSIPPDDSEELPDACDQTPIEAASSSYVKISDGCSRNCAYCTIPMIRGPYRSFTAEDILDDVRTKVSEGAREIVLIGQDTGIWGKDFHDGSTLASLLKFLASRFPNTWFRIMYTQPESIDDELLSTIADTPNVCSYLDIPMQHCSSRVLSSMGRRGSKASLLELVSKIRLTIPDVAIRTTLMAGFPGETEGEFEELVSFVEEACFDYVGVFAFSPEEGTVAAAMGGQIDEDERKWRAERLRTVADAVSSQVISERVGRRSCVLVEGEEEDGQLRGRTMQQAPEVDGVTYIDRGSLGDTLSASIVDTLMYDMEAEVL